MKTRLIGSLAALSLWLFNSAALASPVAMVTDLAGAITLGEAGKSRPAALLAYLEPATTLRIPAGARMVITFFSKPVEVTLTGPAEATLAAEGVQVTKGAAPTVRSLADTHADAARRFEPIQRERVALATVQMRSILLLQLTIDGPSNTNVYSATPLLSWKGPGGVESYRVVVNDSQGNTLVDQTVSGTSLALDSPLRYGASYGWRVEAKSRSGEPLSAKATFAVVDGAQAKRIASMKPSGGAPFSERLLFAAQLQSEGLAYEAKREWQTLAAERPEDPSLRAWAAR